MNYSATSSVSILCLGMGWFPETPGGLNRYVYELILQLGTAQDTVELCGVGLPTKAVEPSIQLTNLADPDNRLPQRLWSVRQQFAYRHLQIPDAINLHFALYSLPLLDRLPRNVPVTFNFHGPWALESQWEGASQWSVAFKHWVEQRVYDRCDRFIVLSNAFGKILHEHYQVPWNKINVIPGGVDTRRFQMNLSRQEARQILGWPTDRLMLFTPRRLVKRVGLDVLLNAFAKVKLRCADIGLAIAGKGAQEAALKQQALELGIESDVKFLGYVPDEQLPIAYQAADLTVMPSQSLEGFGLVLLESLACGTPVLCTPVGGMPEVLNAFCPDLITESAREVAIAERLIDLLTGKLTLPSRFACREYAASRFDWQIVAPQVRDVLLR